MNLKKERNKILIIYGIFLLIFILFPIVLYRIFFYEDIHYSYKVLNGDSEIFLNLNYEKLDKLSKSYFYDKENTKLEYENIKYIEYEKNSNGDEYLKMSIGSKRLLDHKEWGLLYIPGNAYYGNTYYIYDEENETGRGNDLYVVEKLRDNWFFYYNDYSGKTSYEDITPYIDCMYERCWWKNLLQGFLKFKRGREFKNSIVKIIYIC